MRSRSSGVSAAITLGALRAARRIARFASGSINGAIKPGSVFTAPRRSRSRNRPGIVSRTSAGSPPSFRRASTAQGGPACVGFFDAACELFLELLAIDGGLAHCLAVFRRRAVLGAGLHGLVRAAIAIPRTLLTAFGLGPCGTDEEQRDRRGEELSV